MTHDEDCSCNTCVETRAAAYRADRAARNLPLPRARWTWARNWRKCRLRLVPRWSFEWKDGAPIAPP